MFKTKEIIAAALGLLLSACSTVNYTFKGKPCENVLETSDDVVLKCTKHFYPRPMREWP